MPRILVCPPQHFGVEYVINPWMDGNVGDASSARAQAQWDSLVAILDGLCEIEHIAPAEGLPDMCFAANAGFVLNEVFVPAVFSVRQRRPEVAHYRQWAQSQGFRIVELPRGYAFEGEGDALWWPGPGSEPVLWAGYGVRSQLEAHRDLCDCLQVEVVSLRLLDERFYHLDTCFVPLPEGRLIYYPPAFDERSRAIIEERVSADRRIAVEEGDALRFACNMVRVGHSLVSNHASPELRGQLEKWGYEVHTTPLDEFIKAGGAAKCLTLLLEQDLPRNFDKRSPAVSPICSETVEMEGHLLDEGIMTRALDAVTLSGNSFHLEQFRAGERGDQHSYARFTISAPDAKRLAEIMAQLVSYGAARAHEAAAAVLESVRVDGVAPDAFYCSTIYPTQVRVQDQWIRVANQRMDATVVVDLAADPPRARCTLMRDLVKGQQVVCTDAGVRVDVPDLRKNEREFAFMSAGVSTERRVEASVDELALEMRRIRARGGRIVVVAGPVVIHTGGGQYLAELIRAGFVQALLTGNALPVHDIETNLFGTSLGVDLKRGVGVQGGHQHHLRAINQVRRAGSIEAAVNTGIVTEGVMYECVRASVPYVLAGSIRDDGPLPETLMDLTEAQAAYAHAIVDADMILMLSTMLHAIGTGNMTPAGVRLICVDISPAVVTKLADRGSMESVGIVTDVGLFLNLLARRLRPLAARAGRAH